jgi:peptide/nickel transport system substrate-binding protein
MKKSVLFGIVLAFLALGSAFAGGRQAAPSRGNVFNVALHADIVSLDPAFSYDAATSNVVSQIVERLLAYNDQDELVPNIAESWKATDNTTYVYTIRKDVKFSDGSPVTTDDVLFSVQRIGDPATGAYMAWFYEPVQSITKTGDWEITVKLKNPSSSWPYVLATAGGIISKSYYEAHRSNFGTAAGGILATGPYVFESWSSGREIILKKNTNYWNKAINAEIDTVVYKIITENTTLVTALQTGEVEFSSRPPQDMLDQLRSSPSLNVIDYRGFGVVFLAFNTQRAPFNDPNVRKAISHAVDLKSLQENIIKDAGVAGTILPQSNSLYGNYPQQWQDYLARTPAYDYNLAKAREYLAKSSVPNGFTANLVTNNTSLRVSIALVIQNALAPLNIKLEVVELTDDDHTSYQFGGELDANGKRDYDSILAGWWADFPDVANNLEPLYIAGASTNSADYNNPQVNDLIVRQGQLTNEQERNRLIFQALDIITGEAPYLFVEYPSQQVVLNRKYTGLNIRSSVTPQNFYKIRKAN